MNEDAKPVEDDSTPKASLTRRKALGAGAVALGGAALVGLVEAPRAAAANPAAGTSSLRAAAAKGATSITVVNTTGFPIGRTIWLDTPGQEESAVVKSVSASTFTLKLTAPLKAAHRTGARVSVTPPVVIGSAGAPSGVFKTVLAKVLNDSVYSAAAQKTPQKITTDYPNISTLELETLRQCAILSGADVSAINGARSAAMAASGTGDIGVVTLDPTGPALGLSISCCCCSCCLPPIKFPF